MKGPAIDPKGLANSRVRNPPQSHPGYSLESGPATIQGGSPALVLTTLAQAPYSHNDTGVPLPRTHLIKGEPPGSHIGRRDPYPGAKNPWTDRERGGMATLDGSNASRIEGEIVELQNQVER